MWEIKGNFSSSQILAIKHRQREQRWGWWMLDTVRNPLEVLLNGKQIGISEHCFPLTPHVLQQGSETGIDLSGIQNLESFSGIS